MARERMLLDRIRAAETEAQPTWGEARAGEDLERLMESVRRNLGRLLNARHGMSETVPDYGLPAVADLLVSGTDYLRQVQEAIRVAIEKYEPRLRQVRVAHRPDEGHGHRPIFRIDAVLIGRSGEHRVWYEAALSPGGELEVAG